MLVSVKFMGHRDVNRSGCEEKHLPPNSDVICSKKDCSSRDIRSALYSKRQVTLASCHVAGVGMYL